MDTLKDLVADCRDAGGAVIETAARTAPYTYDEFVPNVWKSGNLLGHYGGHPGAEITVVAGPKNATSEETSQRIDAAEPLFAVLGATLLGATVRLQPVEPVESRALVLPAGWIDRYEITPQCTRIAYGGPPTEPDVVHFEEEMWSENPIEPPERVEADDPALIDDSGSYSHRELLVTAAELVTEYDLGAGSKVGLDGPVTEPGAVVALLATLLAEATLVLVESESERENEETAGTDLLVTAVESEQESSESLERLTERLRDTRRA